MISGRSSDLSLTVPPSHALAQWLWWCGFSKGTYSSGNCSGLAPDSLFIHCQAMKPVSEAKVTKEDVWQNRLPIPLAHFPHPSHLPKSHIPLPAENAGPAWAGRALPDSCYPSYWPPQMIGPASRGCSPAATRPAGKPPDDPC